MRNAVISSLLALALFSVSACPSETPSFAVERKTGRLTGHVRDAEGRPVGGARVRVGNRETVTTADGGYAIDAVPEGSTLATFVADGHGTQAVASRIICERDNLLDVQLPGRTSAEVAFSGDVMFGRRYLDPHSDGSGRDALARANDPATFEQLVRHVAPLMREADLAIPNVETAFAWNGVAHPSKPFVFLSPPTSVAALRALGADVASLANNHSYDFFDDGLRSTLEALHGAGIQTMGAGLDEASAYEPLVVSSKGVRVGLSAFCGLRICGVRTGEDTMPDEPPYQDARGESGGVAMLRSDKLVAAVEALKQKSDRIAVLVHGGDEYTETPTSGQHRAAHTAIDLGADLVIGHHPHVLQPFEAYRGKLIAYSLGNLVFDQDFRETWASAVLRVQMTTGTEPLHNFTFDPILLEDYVPYPATGRMARSIVRHLGELSAPHGVTVVEEGSRGRILLSTASTLPSTEQTVTREAVVDLDGRGATASFEEALGPASYLSSITAGSDVKVGRDVLRVGSFEHDLVGMPYDHISGWNSVNYSQHLTKSEPRDGDRAMQICRDVTAPAASGLYSAGRYRIIQGRSYSLCGCFRGHEMSHARASIVYWDSVAIDARPVSTQTIIDRQPGASWECFCAESTPPANAQFVNVRLEVSDASRSSGCGGPDQALHCTDWDAMRLIEWQKWDGKELQLPNRLEFVRVSDTMTSISATARTLLTGGTQ